MKSVQDCVNVAFLGDHQTSEPAAVVRIAHGLQLLNAVDEFDLLVHVDQIKAIVLLVVCRSSRRFDLGYVRILVLDYVLQSRCGRFER